MHLYSAFSICKIFFRAGLPTILVLGYSLKFLRSFTMNLHLDSRYFGLPLKLLENVFHGLDSRYFGLPNI